MSDILTPKEFEMLVRLAKKALWSEPTFRKKLQDQHVNIIPANFYSNTPLVSEILNSFEYRNNSCEVYNCGIFDRNTVRQFLNIISVYANEFNPPTSCPNDAFDSFYWENPAFSATDAMAYYCILRHFKPTRILEIGSGYSTLVAHEALTKNGNGELILIDPNPKTSLRGLETVNTIIDSCVQDIPVSELIDLVENSDIWFIDSTHTVKVGSDCLYIYLIIMPQIRNNILIHTHDVSLPFGFPMHNALNKQIYWTEQYLLYAYMLDNPKIQVLFGSTYSKSALPNETDNFMAGKYISGGGSIWYKLTGNASNESPEPSVSDSK